MQISSRNSLATPTEGVTHFLSTPVDLSQQSVRTLAGEVAATANSTAAKSREPSSQRGFLHCLWVKLWFTSTFEGRATAKKGPPHSLPHNHLSPEQQESTDTHQQRLGNVLVAFILYSHVSVNDSAELTPTINIEDKRSLTAGDDASRSNSVINVETC